MFQKGHKINVGKKRPEHAERMRKLYMDGVLKIYRRSEDFTEETKKKISEAGKKRVPWNKGLSGIKTGPPKGFKPWNTGKHLPEWVRDKISKTRKRTWDLTERKPKTNGWRDWEWMKKVIERDKKCQICGSKENLEAHHIFPKSLFPQFRFNVDKGITLCHECHKKTETYGKRLDLKMKL